MPVGRARPNRFGFPLRSSYSCGLAFLVFLFGAKALQNAVAEGETRTISMHHIHTGEDIVITYKRDGRYVEPALEKLNWFLRDWRRDKETRMDPHLIDLLWEVQRETGSKQPIDVVCGYRSPETNSMLRRRSRGVARFSQHILGHAVDFYVPGVPLEQLRVIGLRLSRGGVGFYPTSGSPFVHMDTGGVRMWPRMTREQLLNVFPDGRTAYVPSDGQPLPGYAMALDDIKKRGQTVPTDFDADDDADAAADATAANSEPASQPARSTRLAGFLAGVKYRHHKDRETAAAALPAAPLPARDADAKPANDLLAALVREAAQRRGASQADTSAHSQDDGNAVAAQAALYQTASFLSPPAPPQGSDQSATPAAELTPNQIIMARGHWEGPPDEVGGTQPANPLRNAAGPADAATAYAPPETTGTVGAWPGSNSAQTPSPTLDYVEPMRRQEPAITYRAQPLSLPAATTVAVKREADQPVSTIVAAAPRPSSPVPAAARSEDPWMRAVLLSPNVRRYLTTLTLGDQDYRALAPLIVKPAISVVMTFSGDPNPGLAQDRFSGSAVVFVSTASYETHTASLP